MQIPLKWLLLLYGLPTRKSAERVNLWRQLKRLGAVSLKTSAYLLPDTQVHFERYQWLAQRVRDGGGEATVIRVTDVEGLGQDQMVQMFNDARTVEYNEFIDALTKLIQSSKGRQSDSFEAHLQKLATWFDDIGKKDFFQCPRATDAQMLLHRAIGKNRTSSKPAPRLQTKAFLGKTWLTRPRPEIDRVGSAWLIRKFIDPRASFVFSSNPSTFPGAIPYDMVDVEFSHHGDDCTIETLVKRFGIVDRAAVQISEMVHEADLEDGKYNHQECIGIDRLLKGWARLGLTDEQLLERGAGCFDALYAFLHK